MALDRPSSPINGSCEVCGEPSAGIGRHYVARCCRSCKGFFRRTVRLERTYKCSNGPNHCDIKESRNACRACRYAKCLAIGLTPEKSPSDQRDNGMVSVEPDGSLQQSPATFGAVVPVKGPASSSRNSAMQALGLGRVGAGSDSHGHWNMLLQHSFPTLMASSKKTVEMSGSFALGSISGLLASWKNGTDASLSHYFLTVERLCESYYDTSLSCASLDISYNLDVSVEEAFFEPRSLLYRTATDWEARFLVDGKMLPRQWCRSVVFYADWASHIPELRELDAEDKLKMLVGRMQPCWWILLASRSIMLAGGKVVFFTNGSYFPLDPEEQNLVESEVAFLKPLCNLINCELICPALDIHVREEEMALLKVLCFCVPVPQLKPASVQIIRSAQARYQASLVGELIKNGAGGMGGEEALMDRLAKIMSWLLTVERVAEESNKHLSLMTLFNIAGMKGSLPYELHVRPS